MNPQLNKFDSRMLCIFSALRIVNSVQYVLTWYRSELKNKAAAIKTLPQL